LSICFSRERVIFEDMAVNNCFWAFGMNIY